MFSEKYVYIQYFSGMAHTKDGGRECFACPLPGYQDQGYLAWFSPDVLYSHVSEKSTNWVMLSISVNFTN